MGQPVCTTQLLPLRFNGHVWTWPLKRPERQYQNVSIVDFIGAKDDGGGEWWQLQL